MKFDLTLAIVVLTAPCVSAQSAFSPTATEPSEKVVSTTLEKVRAHPDSFKNVWVQFPAQFCSIGKVSNPFFTRFVPSQFANFYVWSEDQSIWRKSEYENMFGTLFLSKENSQLSELYSLDLYDRVVLTGIVRNTFQSKPWIEVTSFTKESGKVDTPTLAHMFRGESHMERRQWQRAISELALASAGDVPDNVLAAVHENLGLCYLRLGESSTAVTHLGHARRLRGDRATFEFEQLYLTAKSSPERQLDREVEAVEIGDAERPMWEAFEDASAVPTR